MLKHLHIICMASVTKFTVQSGDCKQQIRLKFIDFIQFTDSLPDIRWFEGALKMSSCCLAQKWGLYFLMMAEKQKQCRKL